MSMTNDYLIEVDAKYNGANLRRPGPKLHLCPGCAQRERCLQDTERARECMNTGNSLFVPTKNAGRALKGPML